MIMSDFNSVFAPTIVPCISVLKSEGRIGICKGSIRISDVNTGCSSSATKTLDGNVDRFTITLPYAGCTIKWEVLFNSHYPEAPPDFIFGPDDPGFVPDIDNLQHLENWKPDDPHCLLNVLEELLAEYREYYHDLLKQYSRLEFEYDSLVKEHNLNPHDIEVHVTKKSEHRVGPTNFLIKLPIDFSRIPAYLTKDNPGEDSALLLVTFQSPECSKVSVELYLSPRVEHVLGKSSSMRIPAYPNGGCLMDYIPSVCELLTNKVEQVVQVYEKRRDFISTSLAIFGRSVVEYDAEAFTMIHFLYEWHDFFFRVGVEMSNQFPAQAPTVTLHSVYHEVDGGKPFSRTYTDCPYSPRWPISHMIDRIRKHVLENISGFQRESVNEGTL